MVASPALQIDEDSKLPGLQEQQRRRIAASEDGVRGMLVHTPDALGARARQGCKRRGVLLHLSPGVRP